MKIGSRAIAEQPDIFDRLASDIHAVIDDGASKRRHVVLVSSGAIAIGANHLGFKARPRTIASPRVA